MNVYETPPMTIGKHEWRATVARCGDGMRLTYEWRRLPCPITGHQDGWRDYLSWPRYDFNNGTTAAMPRSVARLYERHRTAIQAALAG